MVTVILPATNHKPAWIDIDLDGVHMGRVWGEVDSVDMKKCLRQFMVTVSLDGATQAFLWADRVQSSDGGSS